MSGDTFKHVVVGEPVVPSVRLENAKRDAARAHRDRAAGTAPLRGQESGYSTVLVKNPTATDIARGGVFNINAPLFTLAENPNILKQPLAFQASWPAEGSNSYNTTAVAVEPIAAYKMGRAAIAGVVPAQVEVIDELHYYARPHPAYGFTKLRSAAAGPVQIVWAESGTGTKWAVVRLGNDPRDNDVRYAACGYWNATWTYAKLVFTPCAVAGVATGLGNEWVWFNRDQSGLTLPTGADLPAGQIFPIRKAEDGEYYVAGEPTEVVVDIGVNGTTQKLQKKVRLIWATASTIDSDWIDVHAGTDCGA